MTRFTKHLTALVLAAMLASCANPETTPRYGTQTQDNVSRLAYERVNGVDYYEWMGRRYLSEAELIAALESHMADQISAITPEEQPSDKTLRVVLPPPNGLDRGVGRFYHRLDELRLDALRKSGLFTDFQVETVTTRDPGAEGRDFVLYRANGVWRMKDTQGRSLRLLAAGNAPAFVIMVKDALTDLTGDLDSLSAIPLEGGVAYNFRGKEYTGLRGLRSAFDNQLAEDQKRIVGVTPSLADSALVVLPRDTQIASGLTQKLEKLPRASETLPGAEAFQRYRDRRAGQFIAGSGLFKTVRVVTADWAEPEQGAYDWVFWRQPGQHEWMMRPKDGTAFSEAMPDKPESFAEDLRTKLTQPR